MKPFEQKLYIEPNVIEKLLKKTPEKNYLIDVNNLLAQSSLDELSSNQVELLQQKYNIKDSGKKYRNELLAFVTLFLNEHLGNWGSDVNDYQSAHRLQGILHIPEKDFDAVYRPLAIELFRNRASELITAEQKYDERINTKIGELQTKLELPEDKASEITNSIRISIIQDYFNKMVADCRVSPDELEKYEKLCSDMKVTASVDEKSAKLVERFKFLWQIDNGDLPVIQTDIYLQKSESCHFMGTASLFESRKVTTRVNYGGPSFRLKIAKGIYYRTGSYGVSRTTEDVTTLIDTGTLYLTNKRILFTGTRANKTIKYGQIIDFNAYSDGIEIIKESGKNPTFQLNTQDGDILTTTFARILRDNQ